jgi:hypothetical protein
MIKLPSARDTEDDAEVKSVVIVRIVPKGLLLLFPPNVLEIVGMSVASDNTVDDTDGRTR